MVNEEKYQSKVRSIRLIRSNGQGNHQLKNIEKRRALFTALLLTVVVITLLIQEKLVEFNRATALSMRNDKTELNDPLSITERRSIASVKSENKSESESERNLWETQVAKDLSRMPANVGRRDQSIRKIVGFDYNIDAKEGVRRIEYVEQVSDTPSTALSVESVTQILRNLERGGAAVEYRFFQRQELSNKEVSLLSHSLQGADGTPKKSIFQKWILKNQSFEEVGVAFVKEREGRLLSVVFCDKSKGSGIDDKICAQFDP